MRREPLFNAAGFYQFLVDANVLLHREAATAIRARLRAGLERPVPGGRSEPRLRVLDLACGALPITIAEVLAAFPDRRFDYLGVDINPDQVAAARRFEFPANVASVRVLEGNAWDLDQPGLGGGFDLVFSGMNLHHGTPAEWDFLVRGLRERLATGGHFYSHDVYRPAGSPYFPRPDLTDPETREEMRMLPGHRLDAAADLPDGDPRDWAESEPAWRSDYLASMRAVLLERGADPGGVESTIEHMSARDYPLETAAFRRIFARHGFVVETRAYAASDEPMAPYVALCIASKP